MVGSVSGVPAPEPDEQAVVFRNPARERPARAARPPAGSARALHRRLPGYEPTRVVDAPGIASELGLARVAVKDESRRLGLPSFKILGASWAVYRLLTARLPKPDLVIYLEASVETCIKRIRMRGREYERGMDPEYLLKLKDAYNSFFYRYSETPLLVVNTDEIDFVNKSEDFENLIQQIARTRQGTQVYVPLGSG